MQMSLCHSYYSVHLCHALGNGVYYKVKSGVRTLLEVPFSVYIYFHTVYVFSTKGIAYVYMPVTEGLEFEQ